MKKVAVSFALLATLWATEASAQWARQPQPANNATALGAHEEAPRAQPAFDSRIVAVVNDAIISTTDLKARLQLAVLSSGMPDSPDVQKKLLPQVLRTLIDEQLQLQEGKKMNISVTPDDVRTAMARLAEDNKIPGGDMEAFLRAHGISPSTLRTQIKATLMWNKVVVHEVRPHIDIGDDEVDAVIQRMRANAGKQEYLISEIFLPVDKPADEEQVKTLADKLAEEIRGGAVFGAVARQFSQGLGAATGGDIGWTQIGQLGAEIDKVLPSLEKGAIAGPIRSPTGYHLIGVRDRRTIALGDMKEMTVKLEQIFRPFTDATEKKTLLNEAEAIRENVTDCASIQSVINSRYPQWKYQDLGDVKLSEAPPWLAQKVVNIPDGHASEAMATDKGALMLFVCGRSSPENIDRNAIRNAIGSEKMELMARRLLRDLRKSAFLDIRIK